jgi:hypothetical protein
MVYSENVSKRVAVILCVDSAMLVLACVLECLDLTGLALHEWLGFALCPLVLLHVVWQWPWFMTQFRRMRSPGTGRVRVNACLNLLLLAMMAAVLVSGVMVSRLGTSVIGENLGRVRIWSDVHGYLNFIVLVLVGLHLALNWDWLVTTLRRRRPETPADSASLEGTRARVPQMDGARVCDPRQRGLVGAPGEVSNHSQTESRCGSQSRAPSASRSVWATRPMVRGVTVLLVAAMLSGTIYFVAYGLSSPEKRVARPRIVALTVGPQTQNSLTPQPRRIDVPEGLMKLFYKVLVLAVVMLIGRFGFKLRL